MKEETYYELVGELDDLRGQMTGRSFDDPQVGKARDSLNSTIHWLNNAEDQIDRITGPDIKELVKALDSALRPLKKDLDKFEGDDSQLEDWTGTLEYWKNKLKE